MDHLDAQNVALQSIHDQVDSLTRTVRGRGPISSTRTNNVVRPLFPRADLAARYRMRVMEGRGRPSPAIEHAPPGTVRRVRGDPPGMLSS